MKIHEKLLKAFKNEKRQRMLEVQRIFAAYIKNNNKQQLTLTRSELYRRLTVYAQQHSWGLIAKDWPANVAEFVDIIEYLRISIACKNGIMIEKIVLNNRNAYRITRRRRLTGRNIALNYGRSIKANFKGRIHHE